MMPTPHDLFSKPAHRTIESAFARGTMKSIRSRYAIVGRAFFKAVRCRRTLAILMLAAFAADASAQVTAASSASNGLTCARDRAGSNLTCTAGEFTTIVNFQLPAGSPTTCVAGSVLNLSLIVNLSGTNANRFDGAFFIGQAGNDPRVAGGLCSVARFPILSTGTGFTSFDADNCGDYIAAGVETWRIDNVQVVCDGDATTGQLKIPYLLSYQQNNPGVCNLDSSPLLAPGSPSKCNAGTATVPTLAVRGFVRVIKQTIPDAASGSFAFTASTNIGTPTPTNFSLSDGQEQLVETNVTGTTRTLTISEALTPGWDSAASIVCTNPSGGAASYVSVNNATRTITASLDTTNFGAICTITNTKLPILRLRKTLPNGRFFAADQFALTIAGTGGPAAINTTGSGVTATDVATLSPGAVGAVYTFSEAGAAGAALANYATTYACTNALGGGQTPSGSGTSFTLTAMAGDDLTCTLTNTRNNQADLRLTKTNTPGTNGEVDQMADTLVSGATTSYTIAITNNGVDAADGAVLTDPASAGLSCSTATCTSAGGAACPTATGAALVTALQGAGATVPTFPVGATLTFVLSCQVL
jgi:uncharacterized repeat protein (TIGR01451 family)